MTSNFSSLGIVNVFNNFVSNSDKRTSNKEGIILWELLINDELSTSQNDPSYYGKVNDDWAERLQFISDDNIKTFFNMRNLDSSAEGLTQEQIKNIVTEARTLVQKPVRNTLDRVTLNGVGNGIGTAYEISATKHFLDFIGQDVANKDITTILSDLKSDIETSQGKVNELNPAFFQNKISDYKKIYNLDKDEVNKLIRLIEKATGLDLIEYF